MKQINLNTWDVVNLLCIVNIVMQMTFISRANFDFGSYVNGICLGMTIVTIVTSYALRNCGENKDE